MKMIIYKIKFINYKMTKSDFRKKIQNLKLEMLACRNKNIFLNKWEKDWQLCCYIFEGWTIENYHDSYNFYIKLFYNDVKEQMKLGKKLDNIKKIVSKQFSKIVNEMNDIVKETKKFDFEENEELIHGFCYSIVILSKLKVIEPSNNFGILQTDKKPLSIIEIY